MSKTPEKDQQPTTIELVLLMGDMRIRYVVKVLPRSGDTITIPRQVAVHTPALHQYLGTRVKVRKARRADYITNDRTTRFVYYTFQPV